MYEINTRVRYSQVQSDLKVNMATVANYFQDCALFHSESIGKTLEVVEASNRAWFLSGWQIEVKRYPKFNEKITIRTWPHGFKGMYGYRNFDILDQEGNAIVIANSIWIFMDLNAVRPAKATEEDIAGYEIEEPIPMDYAPRKIQVFDDMFQFGDVPEPISVKKSFLDSNHHVNNVRYVTEAMDLLPDLNIKSMRVDYRKAATMGEILYPKRLQKEDTYQVIFSDDKGSPYVILELLSSPLI